MTFRFTRTLAAGLGASALAAAALVGVDAQPSFAVDFSGASDFGNIPDATSSGTLTPVSRQVAVSGLPAYTTDVNVEIDHIIHPYADDLDILVEGPDGTKVMLVSDARGGDAFNNSNLVFDSSPGLGGSTLPPLGDGPSGSPVNSGSKSPSDYDSPDGIDTSTGYEHVAPFTDGTTATTLDAFNGKDPNGVWKVWVVDDLNGNTGSIGGVYISVQATTPPPPPPSTAGKTFIGTAKSETIQGTPGDDVIYGKGGNDKLYGNGGNDIIIGGAGNDKIFGGDGTDTLKGGSGRDKCDGGPGTDTAARNCERKPNVP